MHYQKLFAALCALLIATAGWAGDYKTGLKALESGDYETALAEWQPLAEAGDAKSQFQLGRMYANGFGVDMDDALALKWYQSAADQGHAEAQCNLAVMHQNGWGVPQSEEEAIRYYRLAAEQGVAEALQALGRHFGMDFSEDYDPVEAYKWYSIAASFGDIDANARRESIASKMTADQVADAEAQVIEWSKSHESLQANH